jgi:hypothetical protein
MLIGVPFLIVVAAAVSVFGNMALNLRNVPQSATWPYPAQFSEELTPAGDAWRPPDSGRPDFRGEPGELTLEIVSLDLTSRTVSLRLWLNLSNDIVARLRILKLPGHKIVGTIRHSTVPLRRVPRVAWARVPVGIDLTHCRASLSSPQTCGVPNVTVPLGRLVSHSGRSRSRGVVVSVSLPFDGSPNRFPSDSYVINTSPQVVLPDAVILGLREYLMPMTIWVGAGSGLAENEVTAFATNSSHGIGAGIGVAMDRPLIDQLTVYVVALLPLLLAIVLAHVWVKRRGGQTFDLGFAAGLLAAMLAILPLRVVLVPSDLGAVSLTLVDDILILGILVIAGFLFWQYARFVRAPKPPDHKNVPEDSRG